MRVSDGAVGEFLGRFWFEFFGGWIGGASPQEIDVEKKLAEGLGTVLEFKLWRSCAVLMLPTLG